MLRFAAAKNWMAGGFRGTFVVRRFAFNPSSCALEEVAGPKRYSQVSLKRAAEEDGNWYIDESTIQRSRQSRTKRIDAPRPYLWQTNILERTNIYIARGGYSTVNQRIFATRRRMS